MKTSIDLGLIITSVLFFSLAAVADEVGFGLHEDGNRQIFRLNNERIKLTASFADGKLVADRIEALPQWLQGYDAEQVVVETDGGFSLEIMWTGWRAPGKVSNADNAVEFTNADFRLLNHSVRNHPDGTKDLVFTLQGEKNPFELRVTYQLSPDDFFARRNVAVRDDKKGLHFLRWLWPRKGEAFGRLSVLKPGGFGRPVAFLSGDGGAFMGLEYPASTNFIKSARGKTVFGSGQEMGLRVGDSWIESEWIVAGLSPDVSVKQWFWKYLDRIRVAPLRPYLLYNSWYDVRAPEYTDRPEDVMNEENVLRIIGDFKREMFEKRGLKLDAFVLDDGWDVYKSDWVLRKNEFPNGLVPIVNALGEMGTELGLWFGPIGGYSHRDWRVGWMKERGYEVVGDKLCIAGNNYKKLFKKRVLDFVRDAGVGYYKWDGVQYSCSEPDHGHPVGIFSRRAVMQAVIDLCQAVRAENPEIFLNVTSGTWLSPWWIKYANMIWMQGYDYGYADVPSISRRDAAITYRDFVLYDDLIANGFWFPIANLMTHGIIKGHLQKLGGEAEPLDKFTDNALLYFARGVSMWELYISPNLLSDGEWDALGKSIRWAEDRFEILRNTEMIGGDPGKRQAYGYVHFAGKRGIVAARNPYIEPRTLKIPLSPALGLDEAAEALVIERVYPVHKIFPRLYKAGSEIEISLDGYETAVFEIYSLSEATKPLLSGVTFEELSSDGELYEIICHEADEDARLLNPQVVNAVDYEGASLDPKQFKLPAKVLVDPLTSGSVSKEGSQIEIRFGIRSNVKRATLAILLESAVGRDDENMPPVSIVLDGQQVTPEIEHRKGRWGWYKVEVPAGEHRALLSISFKEGERKWEGKVSVWLVSFQQSDSEKISFRLKTRLVERKPMPPHPWPAGLIRKNSKIGEVGIGEGL